MVWHHCKMKIKWLKKIIKHILWFSQLFKLTWTFSFIFQWCDIYRDSYFHSQWTHLLCCWWQTYRHDDTVSGWRPCCIWIWCWKWAAVHLKSKYCQRWWMAHCKCLYNKYRPKWHVGLYEYLCTVLPLAGRALISSPNMRALWCILC